MVKNLRKLRISRGMSQQQLANVIGTSQQSINKYENHSVEPDIRTLMKLADLFGTTIDYLVGYVPHSVGEDRMEAPELSEEESALVRDHRRLSQEERDSIRMVVKNYLKNKTTPEL